MAFYVAPALRPRMLLTVDEIGSVVPVSVRVGAAVDTVAQAGKPKAITGAGSSLRTLQWMLFLPCRGQCFAEESARSRWTGAVLVCKCLLANDDVVMMGAQSCLIHWQGSVTAQEWQVPCASMPAHKQRFSLGCTFQC